VAAELHNMTTIVKTVDFQLCRYALVNTTASPMSGGT